MTLTHRYSHWCNGSAKRPFSVIFLFGDIVGHHLLFHDWYNVHIVKAMVFPVVMYQCERWTTKKAEHQRIDAFELWCWRRLLRVLWTARRSNHSILKEINLESDLEGLMLKLKLKLNLQYFGYLMRWASSFEKTLMVGKIEGRRIRGNRG